MARNSFTHYLLFSFPVRVGHEHAQKKDDRLYLVSVVNTSFFITLTFISLNFKTSPMMCPGFISLILRYTIENFRREGWNATFDCWIWFLINKSPVVVLTIVALVVYSSHVLTNVKFSSSIPSLFSPFLFICRVHELCNFCGVNNFP